MEVGKAMMNMEKTALQVFNFEIQVKALTQAEQTQLETRNSVLETPSSRLN
jgi:hypothetical protein